MINSHSLKIKLYLLSSADNEQRQDQQQLTVAEKKNGSLTGPPTYVSVLVIKINPYCVKIKTAEFWKSLDQAKQSSNNQFNAEGE